MIFDAADGQIGTLPSSRSTGDHPSS
jgi:hypothetical protein